MVTPNDSVPSEGLPRPAAFKRVQRRYNSHTDIAVAMEKFMELGLNGTISPSELKTYQGALKAIADYLPDDSGTPDLPISERLKGRLQEDPELLEELCVLFPREQLQKLLSDKH